MAVKKISKKKGRPTAYKTEYASDLTKYMAQGMSIEAFAGKLKKSKDTIYKWLQKHEDFADAKKIGDMLRHKFYEEYAVAHLGDKNINTALLCFMMKNCLGYRDNPDADKIDENKTIIVKYSLE